MARYDKLLVLDLDETLVHACDGPLDRPADHVVGPYSIYRRPHLDAFMEAVLERFEHVGVWTASTLPYAEPVLDAFIDRRRLAFVWGRERCTYHYETETHETVLLKPLKKLRRAGYRPEHVLYVDDSPEKVQRSYSNLVPIRPFVGNLDDGELPILLDYLGELGPLPNVRPVEKRWWRVRLDRQAR